MFNGIIRKVGIIKKIKKTKNKVYFIIFAKGFLAKSKAGESISVDGVCLTMIKIKPDSFTAELMPETLRVTKFKEAQVGDKVNLELAVMIGERIDGHFVLGHADGVGRIKKIVKEGEFISLLINYPKNLEKYIARKGSITVNGVSLTIAEVKNNILKVCLISHTLKETNLSDLKVGSLVNLEVDVIARYLEKLLN